MLSPEKLPHFPTVLRINQTVGEIMPCAKEITKRTQKHLRKQTEMYTSDIEVLINNTSSKHIKVIAQFEPKETQIDVTWRTGISNMVHKGRELFSSENHIHWSKAHKNKK